MHKVPASLLRKYRWGLTLEGLADKESRSAPCPVSSVASPHQTRLLCSRARGHSSSMPTSASDSQGMQGKRRGCRE
eukprot:7269300-Alexandrium_andersonii.AAC.1